MSESCAGPRTLRLPYWDYTDPAQVALPADFRNSANTFFDPRRRLAINNGTATLNPLRTNVNTLLTEPDYFKYQDEIDNGVHGHVHCTVGPTCPVAHMGDVPVAANDPVFYTHHANIDRLWACWQQLHTTPAGPWQDAMFSFVDETGTMQREPVKKFLDSAALGYVYDNVAACARPGPPAPVVALAAGSSGERKTTMNQASGGIAIAGPTTNVDLDIPRARLEGALGNLRTAGSAELVLRNITAKSPPTTSFDVFLAARNDPANRQLVGTISWFGAFSRSHRTKDGAHPRTLTYDVTNQLRALGSAATTAGLVVTIEATDGLLATDPARQASQQAEARKEFRAAADVRIEFDRAACRAAAVGAISASHSRFGAPGRPDQHRPANEQTGKDFRCSPIMMSDGHGTCGLDSPCPSWPAFRKLRLEPLVGHGKAGNGPPSMNAVLPGPSSPSGGAPGSGDHQAPA